jgi:hypothetical protein
MGGKVGAVRLASARARSIAMMKGVVRRIVGVKIGYSLYGVEVASGCGVAHDMRNL